MSFQLEVDYYSNEANKNKYTNFPLIASIKNNLKIVEDQIVQGIVLAATLVILCCLDLLLESIFFKWRYVCLSKA